MCETKQDKSEDKKMAWYTKSGSDINTWHYFLKNMKAFLEEQDNEEMSKKINVYILKIFFEEPYNNEDFYTQFEKRMQKMQQIF